MLNTDGLIGIVEKVFINESDDKIYIRTNRIGGGEFIDSSLVYEYYQKKYTKLYGNLWTQGLQADLSLINNEVYFILGKKISKRFNNQFETFLEIDDPDFYQRIWGRNSKDIFLLMIDGLLHYNGSDIKYLFHFEKPRTQIFGAVLFKEDVFFLVDESPTGLSLIFHGKLQN